MTNDPLAWIDDRLQSLDRKGLRRELRERAGPQRTVLVAGGRELVNFGSNDYLDLAADPRLVDAAALTAMTHGWGSGASPLVTGRSDLHAELERRLAEFEGGQAALTFSSGFAANVGTIHALAGRNDVIFSDRKNHASIIDGCRLSGAHIEVYPHCDADRLEAMLQKAGTFRRRLIVTDSLFSMDGDVAPLTHLAELAERYGAMLLVDEAHATGVFGKKGRGVCEHLGVEDRVHVRIGTLSKALGSVGGFVVGSRRLIDWLVHRARSYIFSTAPPAPAMGAAIEALGIVTKEPARREQLLALAAGLRDALESQGWNIGRSAGQIIPVIVGESDRAMRLSASLYDRGLLVPGIRPPSVPLGESLLRISLSYGHSRAMIERLTAALSELRVGHGSP